MILFKYILGKKSTKNLKKDALIPKLIQLYFFPFLLMHVVWWHQQHHTREKSYLNWLALSQKCVFFCTSRSILHLSILYIYILQVNPLGVCFYNHTCYYINATIWNGPPELTVPIYGYIMPMVLLVTFICNALIIIVLSKKHMRTPTNLVLLAMAVSDLLTIVWPAPW